jgi:hypothetical protein
VDEFAGEKIYLVVGAWCLALSIFRNRALIIVTAIGGRLQKR